MVLKRRTFLFSILLLPCLPKVGLALTQDWSVLAKEDTIFPEIPPELAKFKDMPSLNEGIDGKYETGTAPATNHEERIALEIVNNAPTNCTPIDVALYYLSVGQGNYGKEKIPYITAWPVRWNPVIVNFFKATKLKPSGDTTAWCAAFVNYCLMRASMNKNPIPNSSERTKSAAAKSFRSWGRETMSPSPGDIVVFKNKNDPSYGHVGFFLKDMGDKILVIGGNQFEGNPVRHTINRKLIPKNGSVLVFHSYRTEEQLHV